MSRFRDKLVKMIRDVGSKIDDYSISPKIRQILLHYGWFQWYFRYWKMEDDKRQINRLKKIVSRFTGKLVKRIRVLVVNLILFNFAQN